MDIIEAIIIGLSSLRKNKMRSMLTLLGIIIGISGVVGIVSIGSGAEKVILNEFERIGITNEIVVWRREKVKIDGKWQYIRSSDYLEYDDALAIKSNCPNVKRVHTEIGGMNVYIKYKDKGREIKLTSTVPIYQYNRNWFPNIGRFISQEDINFGSKVCVLGYRLWEELCEKRENVIGDEIQINGIRFNIIGIMEEKGNNMASQGWDEIALIPLTTAQKRLLNIHNRVGSIHVQAESFEVVDKAREEVKKVLAWRHKDADKVFDYWIAKKEIENNKKVSAIIKGLLGGVASIALLVGGIGVMNIMLVSVTERTWEIGLRKAVGARKRDILFQFLIESVVISLAGGIIGIVIGILFGAGGAKIFSTFVAKDTNWPSVVSFQSMIIATSVSFIIGIVFGLYPANRAGNLMPTDALRHN